MTIERRDFLKAATTGFAVTLTHCGTALAQIPRPSTGELESGTGSVRLEGQLKAGLLRLAARDFVAEEDRALVIRGKLTTGKQTSADLYCAMFSHSHDHTVFAIVRTDDHSTVLNLSDTDDPKIGQLSVWNDHGLPETFRIDKDKFIHTLNLRESVVGSNRTVDVIGKRKPPEFTAQELVEVFSDNPALLQFRRGKKPAVDPPPSGDDIIYWACGLLSLVPGSLFVLAWVPRG